MEKKQAAYRGTLINNEKIMVTFAEWDHNSIKGYAEIFSEKKYEKVELTYSFGEIMFRTDARTLRMICRATRDFKTLKVIDPVSKVFLGRLIRFQ